MRLEFLQTSHHNLRQVALLVTVRDLDGFVQFALAQCAGHRRSECARLFAGAAVRHQAVYHDANGIGRHEKEADDDDLGHQTHLYPQRARIETYRGLLEQIKRPNLQLQKHCLISLLRVELSLKLRTKLTIDST